MSCHEHSYAGDRNGYARVGFRGRTIGLHRLVYCQTNDVDPDSLGKLVVRHTCDNPRCINPRHLDIGTVKDNTRDAYDRGRRTFALPGEDNHNTKLTDEQCQAIREEYVPRKNGGLAALAREYGVVTSTIHCIVTGTTRAQAS